MVSDADLPRIIFLVEPIVAIFVAFTIRVELHFPRSKFVMLPILYMLLMAVVTPSTLAAYTVVGERDQGTLAPSCSAERRFADRNSCWAKRRP